MRIGTGTGRLVAIAVLCLAAACTYERSQVAKEARNELVGMSRNQILVCMGRPRTVIEDGDLEYFAYFTDSPDYDRVLGVKPNEAQRITGTAKPTDCKVRIIFRDNVVESVSYSGNTGGILTRGEACAAIVSPCLPTAATE